MSREELVAWANESVAFYGLDLTRISTVLLEQAYWFQVNRIFDTVALTHPIKVLEGFNSSNGTRPEKQYRRAPLRGLYKKHFTSLRFLATNLHNFLKSKQGERYSSNICDEAAQTSGSQYIDETFINYLSHHIVFGSFNNKMSSNNMTGEWVVFHKHLGANYYLTFAFHDELDDEIHKRVITACESDNFPFRL